MGTELETTMTDHTAKQFWGGNERGVCVQITAAGPVPIKDTIGEQLSVEGFVQLTLEEAAALCNTLVAFIRRESKRRQALLSEQLAGLQIAQRTVLHEVAALPESLLTAEGVAVDMIAAYCPKYHKETTTRETAERTR